MYLLIIYMKNIYIYPLKFCPGLLLSHFSSLLFFIFPTNSFINSGQHLFYWFDQKNSDKLNPKHKLNKLKEHFHLMQTGHFITTGLIVRKTLFIMVQFYKQLSFEPGYFIATFCGILACCQHLSYISDQGSVSLIPRSLLKCLYNRLLLSQIYLCLLSYTIVFAAKTDNYTFTDAVDRNPLNTLVFALGLLLPDTFAICRICLFTIAISIQIIYIDEKQCEVAKSHC